MLVSEVQQKFPLSLRCGEMWKGDRKEVNFYLFSSHLDKQTQ